MGVIAHQEEEEDTGYWEMQTLSRSGYADKIYGDIYLDGLSDYTQNDRRNHSDAPYIRAVREWITEQIEEYCAEFVKLDHLQASKQEQDNRLALPSSS